MGGGPVAPTIARSAVLACSHFKSSKVTRWVAALLQKGRQIVFSGGRYDVETKVGAAAREVGSREARVLAHLARK